MMAMSDEIKSLIQQCREVADQADNLSRNIQRRTAPASVHAVGQRIALALRDFHTIVKTAFAALPTNLQ
jgi:hypothetical protein